MENFPVVLSDGEIVDLYFAIDTKVREAEEMAEHWACYFNEANQELCFRQIERLRAIRAKLQTAQGTIRASTERR